MKRLTTDKEKICPNQIPDIWLISRNPKTQYGNKSIKNEQRLWTDPSAKTAI